jgi:hypothetical protein
LQLPLELWVPLEIVPDRQIGEVNSILAGIAPAPAQTPPSRIMLATPPAICTKAYIVPHRPGAPGFREVIDLNPERR